MIQYYEKRTYGKEVPTIHSTCVSNTFTYHNQFLSSNELLSNRKLLCTSHISNYQRRAPDLFILRDRCQTQGSHDGAILYLC